MSVASPSDRMDPPGRTTDPISSPLHAGGDTRRADARVVPLAVSPRKAAQYLDVGHDAIYQLLREGRLRSVRLGRRRLIPFSELERFLSEEMT
ncbi:MAG: excisionase family DNA-binding protein [Acidimicrobiales bacterium]